MEGVINFLQVRQIHYLLSEEFELLLKYDFVINKIFCKVKQLINKLSYRLLILKHFFIIFIKL